MRLSRMTLAVRAALQELGARWQHRRLLQRIRKLESA